MKITLLCVGSLKSSWAAEGCKQYIDRLRGVIDFELLELPASKEKDPSRQKEDESGRILEAIGKRSSIVWVLDEQGKGITSEEFSSGLSASADKGETIIFVIGGAYGLNDAVKEKADKIIQLSQMTAA